MPPAAASPALPRTAPDADPNLTRHFADTLLGLKARGLDDAARRAARELVLDGLAVAALGARERGPQILAQLAMEQESAPHATLIGHRRRVAAADAARANGAAMHVLDYEPMWNPANHALSTTLPAVLALAEMLARRGTDKAPAFKGIDLLSALAIGIEAQARLRLASRQFEPAELRFHPPGVVGPIGSAVACGLLLGLDGTGLSHAIGIAASRACGILANVGSMTKALHCGGAAAAGLESALLAQRGFTADADALAGPRGFGQAFFGDAFEPHRLTKAAERLHIVAPGPAFKFYPSQYGTHFVITAALDARSKLPPGAEIAQVLIVSPPMPYVDRPAPASGLAGKFSFQYVAAAALLDGAVTVRSFTDERRFAPDLVALLDRIVIAPDPARQGRFDAMRLDIAVTLADGSIVHGQCDGPPGIWGRPAGAERLNAKARDCLALALDPAEAKRVVAFANRFDHLEPQDVLLLLDTLSRAGGMER